MSEDSITLGDSVLIKVSGADDDAYKEVIVSWWFEVCNYRSGTVNSKSFVGKVLLRIKWKFELINAL